MEVLTGKRFGRWLVGEFAHRSSSGNIYWNCVCDCGTHRVVRGARLRRGGSNSCGCLSKELVAARFTSHGHTAHGASSATYNAWSSMIDQCQNPNCSRFEEYGAKGATVCKRWGIFANFLEDMGEKPGKEQCLYLKKGRKLFSRSNCEWMLRKRYMRARESPN